MLLKFNRNWFYNSIVFVMVFYLFVSFLGMHEVFSGAVKPTSATLGLSTPQACTYGNKLRLSSLHGLSSPQAQN